MYNIGFWVGTHIIWFIPIALMVAGLVVARECWLPSVRNLFTALGPSLAQLGVHATRPPKADTIADHVADLEFWIQARDHGTPAEQAIAPQVLQTLGYSAEAYDAGVTLDLLVQGIQDGGWQYIFRTFGTGAPQPVKGVQISWTWGKGAWYVATLVHQSTGQTRKVRVP